MIHSLNTRDVLRIYVDYKKYLQRRVLFTKVFKFFLLFEIPLYEVAT